MSLTVGEKIRKYRTEKGMTQEELGKVLGVGRAAVQKYETNQVQNLKSSHIKKMCFLFNCRPWDFIFDDEPSEKIGLPSTIEESILLRKILGDELMSVLAPLGLLNDNAKRKVKEYVFDLMKIEEYRKNQKEE